MGFMSKLFGKKATRSSGSGKLSMFALTIQQNYKVSPQRCGSDGQTFPCPSITHTVVTTNIDGFALDVGGYCPSCREFRCPEHVEFREIDKAAYGIHCTGCGTRVTGVAV
ncbi:MAG TPA: hypothetical protein VGQ69_14425 [Gemmatimonadales bacterium]|jgi:hypothetical protein|nr:hypothetical protein [Gemmatimonadales bacterium]